MADTAHPDASLAQPNASPQPVLGGLRLSQLVSQPALKRAMPAIGGLGALAAVGALYLSLAAGPDRTLYSSLTDVERADVVAALENGGVSYSIDPGTGAVTVPESDLYRARMLVASNGAIAAPADAGQMLDSIPLGSSRTLEGERLRLARERELMLTILEIDGIEAARVHLATPERSVFVRESTAPSASVMVRLARGRSLEPNQVHAIVNLVSASVPGMDSGAVRVVDQQGRLLTEESDKASTALSLQRDFESKLREQIAKLLIPVLGEGNFSSEVQVDLVREESTSARESYDNDGAVRDESESRSARGAGSQPGGIPGVLANAPPPPAELVEGAPQGDTAEPETAGVLDTESSERRSYALDREVAVTSSMPGGVARLSVAVAVSQEALASIAPADEEKLKALVEAAVGANAERGDQVTVVVGAFEPATMAEPAFYETGWFAMAMRYGVALLAVLMALLLGVRPLLAILRSDKKGAEVSGEAADSGHINPETGEVVVSAGQPALATGGSAPADLREQVALARKLASEQPDRAVTALQRMLMSPREGG